MNTLNLQFGINDIVIESTVRVCFTFRDIQGNELSLYGIVVIACFVTLFYL